MSVRTQGPAQLAHGRLTHPDEQVLRYLQDVPDYSCSCCAYCHRSICSEGGDTCPGWDCVVNED